MRECLGWITNCENDRSSPQLSASGPAVPSESGLADSKDEFDEEEATIGLGDDEEPLARRRDAKKPATPWRFVVKGPTGKSPTGKGSAVANPRAIPRAPSLDLEPDAGSRDPSGAWDASSKRGRARSPRPLPRAPSLDMEADLTPRPEVSVAEISKIDISNVAVAEGVTPYDANLDRLKLRRLEEGHSEQALSQGRVLFASATMPPPPPPSQSAPDVVAAAFAEPTLNADELPVAHIADASSGPRDRAGELNHGPLNGSSPDHSPLSGPPPSLLPEVRPVPNVNTTSQPEIVSVRPVVEDLGPGLRFSPLVLVLMIAGFFGAGLVAGIVIERYELVGFALSRLTGR